MKDIEDLEDIKIMINLFYREVQKDDLIGPIFNNVIGNNWSTHLQTMYKFWQTVLLHERSYKGSPFHPHRKLPIGPEHFERWLQLFNKCIGINFTGTKTEEAKWRA